MANVHQKRSFNTKRKNHFNCGRCGSKMKKSDMHTLKCTNEKKCGVSRPWGGVGQFEQVGTFNREH